MGHSKGPWKVVKAQRGFIITDESGCYDIAVVRDIGNHDNEANANLIAAAPVILAALRAVESHWNAGNFSRTDELWSQMRDAITKATP